MGDAERWESAANGYDIEWPLRIGTSRAGAATTGTPGYPFHLDLGGAPPFFRKGSLAGLRCVSQVAK